MWLAIGKTVLYSEQMNTVPELDIGARLRDLRTRRKLSQRQLAAKVGVSNATISMIEANRVSPSVSALKQILTGLETGIAAFFASEETEAEKVVFKASELTEIAGGTVSYRQIGSDLRARTLQVIHERYQVGADSGKYLISHQGEEAGLIIKGRMALEVEGRWYELGPGDAYAFDSRKPHRFRNIGDCELVLVSACTPPSF